jgi:hypothetical protein
MDLSSLDTKPQASLAKTQHRDKKQVSLLTASKHFLTVEVPTSVAIDDVTIQQMQRL